MRLANRKRAGTSATQRPQRTRYTLAPRTIDPTAVAARQTRLLAATINWDTSAKSLTQLLSCDEARYRAVSAGAHDRIWQRYWAHPT
jgi:hypothetical protein